LDIDFLFKCSNDDIPIVLIGDAAHSMTPKWEQDADMFLDDAIELKKCFGPIFSKDVSTRTRPRIYNLSTDITMMLLFKSNMPNL
jgi:hypothetical protein